MKVIHLWIVTLSLCSADDWGARKASLMQVNSAVQKQGLKVKADYSSKLAGFQKFAEQMVAQYGASESPQPKQDVLDAVRMVLKFIDEMHKDLWKFHEDDVEKAKCTGELDDCAGTHMSGSIMDEIQGFATQSETAGAAHAACRKEAVDACKETCVTNGECEIYDDYRKNAEGKSPNPASLPLCAHAPDQPAFTDEYIQTDDDSKRHVMEDCLVKTKEWLDGLYPTYDGLYPKYKACNRNKKTCDDKVPECDGLQHNFEQAREIYALDKNVHCNDFKTCWESRWSGCKADCDAIAIRSAARAADNETGERLVCLLHTLFGEPDALNENGTHFSTRASDEERPGLLAACNSLDLTTFNDIWTITCPVGGGSFPPETPEYPEGIDCSTKVSSPCSDDFISAEYQDFLTALPAQILYGCEDESVDVQRGVHKVIQACGTSPGISPASTGNAPAPTPACVEPERSSTVYTGCGYTYQYQASRDKQCPGATGTTLIINNDVKLCDVERNAELYVCSKYTYSSSAQCERECGRFVGGCTGTSGWIGDVPVPGPAPTACVEPDRGSTVYTGCGYTYQYQSQRDQQCGGGGTSMIINDGVKLCDVDRNTQVYSGCGYTYSSYADWNAQCGSGGGQSGWIGDVPV